MFGILKSIAQIDQLKNSEIMEATAALLLLAPLTILVVWWVRSSKTRGLVNQLPGPPTLPLIGNAHQLKSGGVDFLLQFSEYCRTYADKTGVFRLWFGTQPVVVLAKAEAVEVLMTSSTNITKSFFYKFLFSWLGTGLLTSTGEKWYVRRKLLTPAFHFNILRDFLQVFNEQACIMVERLGQQTDKKRFDVTPFVTLCALDIICETAMGTSINAQSNNDSEYVKTLSRISEIILTRMKQPWRWPDFLFNLSALGKDHEKCLQKLHGFTDQVIRERRAQMEEIRRNGAKKGISKDDDDDEESVQIGRKRKRLAFLDLLLQTTIDSAGSLTEQDIREEVDTFMFEGHDTIAAAITWALYLVGANPRIQEKLQQEVDRLFGDSDRQVTMDDINELKYLERVIKEALRLFPSVPFFGRWISEDCTIGGYFIPKDVMTMVSVTSIHLDPNHFPEPERFDPDRWLLENSAGRHPFCFIPFSAGPRNCIGQKFAMIEEKVLLTYIVRRFEITSLQSREELRPCGELVMRPENGVFLRIEKRNKATQP